MVYEKEMIKKEIIEGWHDHRVALLVEEYYKMFRSCHFERGGLQQSLVEITEVMGYVMGYLGGLGLRRFVEIGSSDGGSLWMYGSMSDEVIGIDIGINVCAGIVANRLREIGKKVELVVAKCEEVVEDIGSIDLLHIDADHDYDSVKRYFDLYSPKVRGAIVIHDTVANEGSRRFREEVELKYDCVTFSGGHLISGDYDIDPNIPNPGTTIVKI